MPGKPRKNPVTDAQILEAYDRTRSAYKVAAELGIGSTTVERVLTREKVERTGLADYRRQVTLFRGQEDAIRREYESGATYTKLLEKFGKGSYWSIKSAIKRAGGVLRDNPVPRLDQEELVRIKELRAAGKGQMAISLEIGRSQVFVSRAMRKHGIATQRAFGPDHPQWKGGRFTDGNGYIKIWVSPEDKFSGMRDCSGYVYEHRLVMARKLGRPLTRSETVHHIDGNRQNNAPDNLQLRQGKHGKHIVLRCLDCGSHNVGPADL